VARPKLHDDSLRAAILERAGDLFAIEGPGAVTVRRVADAASTSTAAVYDLFGDKNGLVRVMFVEGFRRLAAHFDAVPTTDDPTTDLRALGLAFRASALANPQLYELMFGCPFPDFRPTDAETTNAMATFATLVTSVRRCIDAGALPPGDPLDVAMTLFALVHGLASLEQRGWLGTDAEAERRWTMALDAMQTGLRDGGRPTAIRTSDRQGRARTRPTPSRRSSGAP
jgi:AcrR family transcriptional regulator